MDRHRKTRERVDLDKITTQIVGSAFCVVMDRCGKSSETRERVDQARITSKIGRRCDFGGKSAWLRLHRRRVNASIKLGLPPRLAGGVILEVIGLAKAPSDARERDDQARITSKIGRRCDFGGNRLGKGSIGDAWPPAVSSGSSFPYRSIV